MSGSTPPSGPDREPPDWWQVVLGVLIVVVSLVVAVEGVLLLSGQQPDEGPRRDRDGARSIVPDPPGEARSPGSYVESRLDERGAVTVQHWVQSAEVMSTVGLDMPPMAGRTRSARATNLLVAADGVVLTRRGAVGAAGRIVTLEAPAKVVYLRYTLRRVATASASAEGRAVIRALALTVRPLTGPTGLRPRTGPVRVVLVDGRVLSVACLRERGAAPRPCGTPTGRGWRVVLRGPLRSSSVQAQVRLD